MRLAEAPLRDLYAIVFNGCCENMLLTRVARVVHLAKRACYRRHRGHVALASDKVSGNPPPRPSLLDTRLSLAYQHEFS